MCVRHIYSARVKRPSSLSCSFFSFSSSLFVLLVSPFYLYSLYHIPQIYVLYIYHFEVCMHAVHRFIFSPSSSSFSFSFFIYMYLPPIECVTQSCVRVDHQTASKREARKKHNNKTIKNQTHISEALLYKHIYLSFF